MIGREITEKLHKIGIDVEYKRQGIYEAFRKKYLGKKILVICDRNTLPYAKSLQLDGGKICLIDEYEPVPDERVCGQVFRESQGYDYILAVGSGTLNDTAKYVAYTSGKKSGVLATAPSMDGYASPVAPVIINGFKDSKVARAPSDILIDAEILAHAPQNMIAAGVGDILGKYTSLTDWRLAQNHIGEEVNETAYRDMTDAVNVCLEKYDDIVQKNSTGLEKLTDALIISGLSIAETGNSRPASGAEHHISHYLEMYFISQKKPVPLHGIKVGLGTLISSYLYYIIKRDGIRFKGYEQVLKETDNIPETQTIKELLQKVSAPTRFSELGISEAVFEDCILNAYKVRKRFTVLTLFNELDLLKNYLPELKENFY